jgi:sodium/potassium/calcium exchanger 6
VDSLTVPWPRKRSISSPGPQRLELHTQLPPRSHSHLHVPSADDGHTYRMSQMPSFSLVGALEFRQIVASLQRQGASSTLDIFESPVTPYAGGHYHAHRRHSTYAREVDTWDATLGVPLDDRSPHQTLHTHALSDEAEESGAGNEGDEDGRTVNPSIVYTAASSTASDIDTESQQFSPPPKRRHRVMRALDAIYHTLCPSLHHLGSKTVLGKVAAIFAAPAIMALTLTLPVVVTPYYDGKKAEEKTFPSGSEGRLVDFEEEGIERVLIAEEEVQEDMHDFRFSKWLTAAQCIFGPLFCVGVLFGMYVSSLICQ